MNTAKKFWYTVLSGGGAPQYSPITGVVSPDELTNQILWLRETNSNTSGNVDQWDNKYNSANDLLKVTDARRPDYSANGFDTGLPSFDFVRANTDILRSEASLGLTGSVTYYVLFKCDPSVSSPNALLFTNAHNDTAFANVGIVQFIGSNTILVDFRDGSGTQRITVPFTDTGWHLLTGKHYSNGTSSVNIVKIDGAIFQKDTGKNAISHGSNTLKIGGIVPSSFNPLSGSIAELVMNAKFEDVTNEAGLMNYLNDRYSTEFGYIDDSNFFEIGASIADSWNGLDSILRDDGKYDFVAANLSGEIYYFTQGASVDSWTSTLLIDTTVEIQSLKVFGRDSSDRLVLVACHKDSSSDGSIRLYRADTTDDKGAYTAVTLQSSRAYPQDILVYDVDGDGEDEFLYTYQGLSSGQGGIRWFKCGDFSDIANASNWTEYNAYTHESAWWLAGWVTIGGSLRLLYSARDNRNSSAVPGIYYLTPAATITDVWTRTTVDNASEGFMHVDFGNFFGNDNDIVACSQDGGTYIYDSGNSYARTQLYTVTSTDEVLNVKTIPIFRNNRNVFIQHTNFDFVYLWSYNGSSWEKRKLMMTEDHTGDNEILYLDIDGSGQKRVIFDNSKNLSASSIITYKL